MFAVKCSPSFPQHSCLFTLHPFTVFFGWQKMDPKMSDIQPNSCRMKQVFWSILFGPCKSRTQIFELLNKNRFFLFFRYGFCCLFCERNQFENQKSSNHMELLSKGFWWGFQCNHCKKRFDSKANYGLFFHPIEVSSIKKWRVSRLNKLNLGRVSNLETQFFFSTSIFPTQASFTVRQKNVTSTHKHFPHPLWNSNSSVSQDGSIRACTTEDLS